MTLKSAIVSLAHHSGVLSACRWGAVRLDQLNKRLELLPQLERGTLILVFRRIVREDNPFQPGTPIRVFDEVCSHLARHYDVVSLDELEARRLSRRPPSAAVAITFDDGYADNYTFALPVLRRHGLPATVFITTGCMEGRQLLWTSRLGFILEHGTVPEDEPVRVLGRRRPLHTRALRLEALRLLEQELKETDRVEREEVLLDLSEKLGVEDFSGLQGEMLTWEQLADMERHGVTAGGHTVSHPVLSREPLPQIRSELEGCKEELEARLGHPVQLFAYPNGGPSDYNLEVMDEVRRVGYRLACTMQVGANTTAINAYELRRASVDATRGPEIALQLERFFYLT